MDTPGAPGREKTARRRSRPARAAEGGGEGHCRDSAKVPSWAVCWAARSTPAAARITYIDDLFVCSSLRGRKVGHALMLGGSLFGYAITFLVQMYNAIHFAIAIHKSEYS